MDDTPDFRRWSRATKIRVAVIVALPVVLSTAAWAWMIRMPGASYEGALPPLTQEEVSVRDGLKSDLDRIVGFGERNVAHPEALEGAAAWIESTLKDAGYAPARQTEDVDGVTCANVEVERRGTSDEIVVVGAHYDSARGTAGANDNGTGVASLLALARAFAHAAQTRTLRFVAFVNEEPPHFRSSKMGSAIYAARAASRGEKIVAMLSLETMGFYSDAPGSQGYPIPMSLFYPDRGDFIGFIGDVGSRDLVRSALGTFRATTQFPSQGAALPAKTIGVGWSDHASFWAHGYPAVMVTDTALFRYRQYHSPSDTVDRVDVERLARVTRGLQRVIEVLGGAPMSSR